MDKIEHCPVCGMDVKVDKASPTSQYQNKTYYFCGIGCQEKFDANPAQYVHAAARA